MSENDIKIPNKHLLKNRKALEEISRHLWIESERLGYDIGFDKAAEDWLLRFSKAWMQYHLPKKNAKTRQDSTSAKKTSKRRAAPRKKSYSKK